MILRSHRFRLTTLVVCGYDAENIPKLPTLLTGLVQNTDELATIRLRPSKY